MRIFEIEILDEESERYIPFAIVEASTKEEIVAEFSFSKFMVSEIRPLSLESAIELKKYL